MYQTNGIIGKKFPGHEIFADFLETMNFYKKSQQTFIVAKDNLYFAKR